MKKLLIGAAAVAIAFAPFSSVVMPGVAHAAPCNGTEISAACTDCVVAHGGAVPCMDIAQQPVPQIAGTPGDECSRYSAPDETAAHNACELAVSKGGHVDN